MDPLGTINVCTKCHDNVDFLLNISVCTKVVVYHVAVICIFFYFCSFSYLMLELGRGLFD